MRRSITGVVFVGLVAALVITRIGPPVFSRASTQRSATPPPNHGAIPTPTVVHRDGYGFKIPSSDVDRYVHASDVFLGRVTALAPASPVASAQPSDTASSRPQTQTVYTVVVIQTIKGNATGTVLVHQDGLYDRLTPEPGADPSLLTVGETAMFVTDWRAEQGWYDLLEGRWGHTRVDDDVEQATVVARFVGFRSTATASAEESNELGGTPAPSLIGHEER